MVFPLVWGPDEELRVKTRWLFLNVWLFNDFANTRRAFNFFFVSLLTHLVLQPAGPKSQETSYMGKYNKQDLSSKTSANKKGRLGLAGGERQEAGSEGREALGIGWGNVPAEHSRCRAYCEAELFPAAWARSGTRTRMMEMRMSEEQPQHDWKVRRWRGGTSACLLFPCVSPLFYHLVELLDPRVGKTQKDLKTGSGEQDGVVWNWSEVWAGGYWVDDSLLKCMFFDILTSRPDRS